jgi:hypothetical protein
MARVKGVLLETTIIGIRGSIAAGRLSRESVETRLEPADVELLDAKVEPTRWYPVEHIVHMMDLLAEQMGGPRDEALRRLGAAAVDILRQSANYPQLDFEEGCVDGAGSMQLRGVGRKIASMWPAMYDFGQTRVESVPDSTEILLHYEDLGDSTGPVRYTIEGFTRRIASLVSGGALGVTYDEPAVGHLIARIGPGKG